MHPSRRRRRNVPDAQRQNATMTARNDRPFRPKQTTMPKAAKVALAASDPMTRDS